MRPLVEVWKIDLASSINMFTHFHLNQPTLNRFLMASFFPFNYLHVWGWLDVAEGRMIRMCVEQVQRDGDVVILTPVWHRDCALVIKIFSLVFLLSYPTLPEC